MSADGRAEESPQQGIQSIEVGAQVLRALEAGRGPMTLSEVARNCAMHPAKVHRYLVSLVRAGLASQDARTGQYDLGPAPVTSARRRCAGRTQKGTAAAYTSRLRDQSGHTTNMAVWTEDGPIIVRWDSGTHVLPINVRVGSVLPLLDSAAGLMFLAHLPAAQTAGVLATQQARRETHTPSAAALEKLLVKTRRGGIASSLHRLIYGMAAFGAPVLGPDRGLVLAIGLAMPARLLVDGEADGLADALRSTAGQISAELGYRPA
ncbi:MAG TPA: IclR family transcriptional regulator [Streptosporangiaceae bacterium]|jgi:DNA-binding IclR family transcriptional regulator|nr:IclR family transcriptional regulator [Streptosporangiaceae bacterium]